MDLLTEHPNKEHTNSLLPPHPTPFSVKQMRCSVLKDLLYGILSYSHMLNLILCIKTVYENKTQNVFKLITFLFIYSTNMVFCICFLPQDEGWLLGILELSGIKGVFPANFTKRI